jgi:putative flavoprotein involved in K+ transport
MVSEGSMQPPPTDPGRDAVETHEAIVVGAGSAGLAAAVALRERGFGTTIIERAASVGTSWRSRYSELRLNSWRPMSKLQGRGMPRSYGRYPHRDDVIEYLEQFTVEHYLSIRFNTRALRVDRDGDLWRLHTSARPMRCRYLVIATGWDAVPVLPAWPGRATFVPELIHSSEFRGARRYRGRDVLVVGAGNSGIDIASHLV